MSEGYERLPDGDWCRVCKDTWVPSPRTVCRECMGLKDPEAIDHPICPDCGRLFEPWLNGRFHVKSICKSCMNTKRVAKVKAVWAANGGKKPGGRKPRPKQDNPFTPIVERIKELAISNPKMLESINPNTVTLDFSAVPEVLAWLKEHHPDLQAYFMEKVWYDVPPQEFKNWMLDRIKG